MIKIIQHFKFFKVVLFSTLLFSSAVTSVFATVPLVLTGNSIKNPDAWQRVGQASFTGDPPYDKFTNFKIVWGESQDGALCGKNLCPEYIAFSNELDGAWTTTVQYNVLPENRGKFWEYNYYNISKMRDFDRKPFHDYPYSPPMPITWIEPHEGHSQNYPFNDFTVPDHIKKNLEYYAIAFNGVIEFVSAVTYNDPSSGNEVFNFMNSTDSETWKLEDNKYSVETLSTVKLDHAIKPTLKYDEAHILFFTGAIDKTTAAPVLLYEWGNWVKIKIPSNFAHLVGVARGLDGKNNSTVIIGKDNNKNATPLIAYTNDLPTTSAVTWNTDIQLELDQGMSIASFDKIVFGLGKDDGSQKWILLAHVFEHPQDTNSITTIFTSSDGIHWQRVKKTSLPFTDEDYHSTEFNDVAWDGDQWVVVGSAKE